MAIIGVNLIHFISIPIQIIHCATVHLLAAEAVVSSIAIVGKEEEPLRITGENGVGNQIDDLPELLPMAT